MTMNVVHAPVCARHCRRSDRGWPRPLNGMRQGRRKKASQQKRNPLTPLRSSRPCAAPSITWSPPMRSCIPLHQSTSNPKLSSGPAHSSEPGRSCSGRANFWLELETADLAAAAEETKHQYEQAQAVSETLTGATVAEDRAKAESDVKSAQQALDTAQKLYDNRVALQREGALAQKLVDDAKVAFGTGAKSVRCGATALQGLNQVSQREAIRGSQAQVAAAKAHYDSALVQASYGQIRSPINGVISDRSIYPGEIAASGSPLVSIVDISQLVARTNVPVKDATAISVGRPARITGPEGDLAGKVTVVSPAVDPNTTTIEVWVQVPNPGEKLKPGGTVRVSIIAETIQNTIIVPAAALLNSDEGGQKVMVVDKDSIAHERKIVPGVRQGERVQIVTGLQEGEQVATSGGLGLEDKAKVTIQKPKSEDDEDADDAKDEKGK